MIMKRIVYLLATLTIGYHASSQVKILFDATKAETAGNADWIVDADLHNLGWNPNATIGAGNESNAQRYPTPAQSGITASTPETYWMGSLSSWGVALAQLGYLVETLPYNGQITYGSASNPQDLTNYKVFIIDEPNILFTTAEKTALINFVNNGGGLFIISDHNMSDRNGDGQDSPHILNDLMSNNGISSNPFGITYDYQNYSETTSNFAVNPTDTILHGSQGNPTQMKISNGTTMSLSTSANATVKPLIYKTGVSNTGSTGVYMCYARYGNGKVAALGDSSPPDDGTGDPNDNLYNGWSAEVNGDHARVIMNATIWLAMTGTTVTGIQGQPGIDGTYTLYPNPAKDKLHIAGLPHNEACNLHVFDGTGREVFNGSATAEGIDVSGYSKGLYYYQLTSTGNMTQTGKFIVE